MCPQHVFPKHVLHASILQWEGTSEEGEGAHTCGLGSTHPRARVHVFLQALWQREQRVVIVLRLPLTHSGHEAGAQMEGHKPCHNPLPSGAA